MPEWWCSWVGSVETFLDWLLAAVIFASLIGARMGLIFSPGNGTKYLGRINPPRRQTASEYFVALEIEAKKSQDYPEDFITRISEAVEKVVVEYPDLLHPKRKAS
jgi:hypothetical protein